MDIEKLTRELTDKGLLIEAGFVGLRAAAMAPDAPQWMIDDARQAFFAGAAHLFASIMTVLDPGGEQSEADLKRMDLIHAELKRFITEFEMRHIPTKGRA